MKNPVLAPAALAAAIAIPFLIGAQSADSPPPQPAPREAALVIGLDGEEGTKQPYPLRIVATGDPQEATLVDESGLHAAHVGVADAQACADAPVRSTAYTGLDAQDWCLELTDVPEHEQVTGVVPAAAEGGLDGLEAAPTSLALTVTHRMAFDGWPLFFLVTGMLASLAAAWFLLGLKRGVRAARLDRLLERNEAADASTAIAGLGGWLARRQPADSEGEGLLQTVELLLATGAAEAREARSALGVLITAAGDATGYELMVRAIEERDRRTHTIGDFRDEAGQRVVHPASTLGGQVATMTALHAQLEQLAERIETRIKDDAACRERPLATLAQARDAWADVADAAGIERALDAYEHALATARAAWTNDACGAGRFDADEDEEGPLRAWRERTLVAPASAEPADTRLRRLALATIAVAVVAFGIAAVTVWQAVYDADATFGSWGDCVALFLAAAASSFAGTVAGLLSPWGIDLADD